MDTLALVKSWHEHFQVPVLDSPILPADRVEMRLAILEEEVQELRSAVEAGDIVEVLDALCDIQYVLDGNFLEFGLHKLKHAAFSEVHASNMSKLGEDGQPILREDGKVLKGPNFFGPDLAQILKDK
ncbi:MAG: nucleoside triphosphate pyrophosphohydrolase family protein [Pseudomonadota bacterium]